jgi:hypothetical protein
VARIFLSHSSADGRQAVALRQWLVEQESSLANEIFLDIGASTALHRPVKWKDALKQAGTRCEVVICLVSPHWVASAECRTEYRAAEGFGKQILFARLEDIGDTDITSDRQRCDLFGGEATTTIDLAGGPPVHFNAAGLRQILRAVQGAGIGPENFVWPPMREPDRAPYRGWEPFEDIDAGVFFGRDAAIVHGLDELRGMRLSGLTSILVVLGASGSGKSSFLRAGLVPRLQRDDRRFLVLGVMRADRNVLTGDHGLAAAIHTGRMELGLRGAPLGEIREACEGDPGRLRELLAELRAAAARLAGSGQDGAAPTLVLPLDQAEELFSADAGAQAEQFLQLIADPIAAMNTTEAAVIVTATIRTDRYEAMQSHPALVGIGAVLFDELKPMPLSQFSEVISGPAARVGMGGQRLTVAPDLVNRLIADAADGANSLPLLAFTLKRLYMDYAGTGELNLDHYQAIGGMRDVVNNEIDDILSRDPIQRQRELTLLRAAFIPWLATINPDNDHPMRRVARQSDLPDASRSLIEAFVSKRLLVRDERDGQAVVEVALESLLRQWDDLAVWLREERQNIQTADDVERSAAAWAARDRDPAWLLTGTRLADAENLASAAAFSHRLVRSRDYLAACREAEDEMLAAREALRQADLRRAQDRQRIAEAEVATEARSPENRRRGLRPRNWLGGGDR